MTPMHWPVAKWPMHRPRRLALQALLLVATLAALVAVAFTCSPTTKGPGHMHDSTIVETSVRIPDPVLERSLRVAEASRERLAALVALSQALAGARTLDGGAVVVDELREAIETAERDLAGAVVWLERVERARRGGP